MSPGGRPAGPADSAWPRPQSRSVSGPAGASLSYSGWSQYVGSLIASDQTRPGRQPRAGPRNLDPIQAEFKPRDEVQVQTAGTVVSKSAGTDTGPGPAAGSHVPKIQLEA